MSAARPAGAQFRRRTPRGDRGRDGRVRENANPERDQMFSDFAKRTTSRALVGIVTALQAAALGVFI